MDPKLIDLDNSDAPSFRYKVQWILANLHKEFPDTFIADSARTLEQQKKKVANGFSKTLKSKHVVSKKYPKSRAADIVPKSTGWNAPRKFWLMLAAQAIFYNLKSGAFFGLNKLQRQALHRALALRQWDAPVKIGWDPAHVETLEVEK